MLNYQFTEESIQDLVLKYAEEAFNVRDALNFEILIKQEPKHLKQAQINRSVRSQLQALPLIKSAPGFEERLFHRIANDYCS